MLLASGIGDCVQEDHYAVDLLAGFAGQLDDKMRCLWMERANIECHSLAALDFISSKPSI